MLLSLGLRGALIDPAAITSPAGLAERTTGFDYTPPVGATTVSLAIRWAVPSGGVTVSPVLLDHGCGEWQTFVVDGPDAFR